MRVEASAFILIGGKSSRLGYPKWKTELDGKPLFDYAWGLCGDLFDQTFVVTKREPVDLDKPVIYDLLDTFSPLSGLYGAGKIRQ